MLKKLLLGISVLILLIGAWIGFELWTRHEPFPEITVQTLDRSPAASALSAAERAALGELLEDYRERHHLPSISLAIGIDGEIAYLGAVGFADLAREQPATPDTRYRTGSVSKAITTVALGRLVEEGVIDLDKDFRTYVPDFPQKKWSFTPRQLASHTAGIRHYVNPMENYRDEHYDTVQDALVTIEEDRMIFEPGTRFGYSSYGFNMLSAAMANAADTPFRDLLDRLVFGPANMTATGAEDPRDPHPDSAGFYLQTPEWSLRAPYADNSYKVAGGGLLGTPGDLVNLGNALLAGALLQPETWNELTTVVPLADGNTDHGYGLGFGVGEVRIGERTIREIGHSGGSVGGLTVWKLFDDVASDRGSHDVVVAATINISDLWNGASPHAVAYQATEIVLDALDAGAVQAASPPVTSEVENGWIELFDGKSLDGWIPKVRGYPAGENALDTFRVEDGALVVSYDEYERFDNRFGHLFTEVPFSHYRLKLEYRFVGDPTPGTESWAIRNSGAMLHAQAPGTMPDEQDFPISVEFQFLGGLEPGVARPTGNLCTPGTHVTLNGAFTEEHCLDRSPITQWGDGWVEAEATVLGGDRIVHRINGEVVTEYTNVVTGGGVVSGHDPAMKPEGEPLGAGHIALQSEGHRVEFRNIRLLNLKGCMNPHASNYETWFAEDDPEACRF
jgi:CubicO group peptidase (beta-lactamase class C family)